MLHDMPAPLHEKIRQIIERTPGLTQKGLADALGLNPAAVNRMLHGQRRIMAEEIPLIEAYLGHKLIIYAEPPAPQRGFSDGASPSVLAPPMSSSVPVYGPALQRGEVTDWVQRHPAQFGLRDAFAVYVFSDDMAPRYFKGELAYIHPGRPAESGRDCLIEMKDGNVFLLHLLERTAGKLRTRQFNPDRKKDFSLKDIRAVYAVLGRG